MTLPFCHSRRELPTTPGELYCVHPRVHSDGQRVSVAICQMCNYWQQPAPAEFQPFPPPAPRGQCTFLGEMTGLRECQSCRGRVQIKIFACRHPAHLETTWEECRHCPDHQELDSAASSERA